MDDEARSRAVQMEKSDRYFCPWPGCRRSFPELWRLRQHFRAPATSCGSGKGLGHSTELKICPKCGGKFKPGRHHVKCLGNIAPHLAVRYYAQRGNESSPEVEEEEDPTKFYCPWPGCDRSYSELSLLKRHFRAPPDPRGSGKERGHGTELPFCPKCGQTLRQEFGFRPRHVGCPGRMRAAAGVQAEGGKQLELG